MSSKEVKKSCSSLSAKRKLVEVKKMRTKYSSLEKDDIEKLLKRAKAMHISCKINYSEFTDIWRQQCILLWKLLDKTIQ